MTADARSQDAQARSLAQTEFARPVALEAGAGTGKTAALVARVVAWCLGPGWSRAVAADPDAEPERVAARVLRRVVAITFGEAAAAEMAERVGAALSALEAGHVPVGVDLAVLPDRPEVRAAALRAGLDQLRVQTIHSFCRRLLAEHPLEARLHPRFVIDADESGQKAVVREVLASALPGLFENSDALLELVRRGVVPGDLEDALLLLVRGGVAPGALDAGEILSDARVARFLDRIRQRVGAFVDLEGGRLAALGKASKRFSGAAAGLASLADRLPGRDAGFDSLEALAAGLPEDGLSRTSVAALKDCVKKGTFGKRGDGVLGGDVEALVDLARPVAPLLAHLLSLDPVRLRATLAVLAPLYTEVAGTLRARGIETFAALLRDTRDLLTSSPGVCRTVRAGIDQLLVDEFQDTDPVQCDILRRLAFDGSVEDRPGLFLVGDPKQSIYGWRNADLAAYDGFLAELQRAGGRVETLVVNYRSTPAVLDEVSRLFPRVMEASPGVQPPFVELLASPGAEDRPLEAGRAPVEHWVSWDWDAENGEARKTTNPRGDRLEADAVAADLVALHEAGTAWNRIGLLFRASTAFETYLAALRRAGVPFAIEGDRNYFSRREIIEAGAMVRCVLDPNDQLALLTFLRSSVVGVPDAALIPLWDGALPRRMGELTGDDAERLAALVALLDRVQAQLPGDIPGIERVAGWTDNLRDAAWALGTLRAAFDADGVDVFVEKLRRFFLFEVTESARHLGAYRLANLDRFFRDLSHALRDGEGDPQAVLRSLREDIASGSEAEEGRPREAIEDAVRVMTIHRAKGLDFDHVYVLQLHKGSGSRGAPRAEALAGRFEFELAGARTLDYDELQARRAAVERAERVRTLYVAATRARRRLVLAGVHPEKASRRTDTSHAALLAERIEGLPDRAAEMQRLSGAGETWVDAVSARWCFPALAVETERRAQPRRKPLYAVAEVRRMSGALDARRAQAAARGARRFRASVSATAHEAWLEEARERGAIDEGHEDDRGELSPRAAPRTAAAVGTAVHQVLETLDLTGDLAGGLSAAVAEIDERLDPALSSAERRAARERAGELLEALAGGPLLERLREIAPHVVARELPVLLPPEARRDEGPVGFLAGAVDLLYRDPQSGAYVVADYKTDRLDDDAALEERAEHYAAQGAGYVRAVQGALGLPEPPRFELWFLDAGRIREVSI